MEQWLKFFRSELPTVAFKCNLEQQKKNTGRKSRKETQSADLLQASNCLGAETLLQLLRNYSRSQKVIRYSGGVFFGSVGSILYNFKVVVLTSVSCADESSALSWCGWISKCREK